MEYMSPDSSQVYTRPETVGCMPRKSTRAQPSPNIAPPAYLPIYPSGSWIKPNALRVKRQSRADTARVLDRAGLQHLTPSDSQRGGSTPASS